MQTPYCMPPGPCQSGTAAAGIRHWPRDQRPREKLAAAGATALADAELLALFLRTGLPGKNAVELSRELLRRFDSLQALLRADAAELRRQAGLGPAKIAQLQAISEIVRRALDERLRTTAVLDSPKAVRDALRLALNGRPQEIFTTLYLDTRLRLLHTEESSRGTLTQAAVYPREIAREALRRNAAALIVAHNHPSGHAEPSASDRRLTVQLKAALDLLDIRLLDHFVIGTGTIFSFAEHGWL